jgi:hypothetical protein
MRKECNDKRTLSKLTQVLAVGSLSSSEPASRIEKFGTSSLNPSSGGLLQLDTNLKSARF